MQVVTEIVEDNCNLINFSFSFMRNLTMRILSMLINDNIFVYLYSKKTKLFSKYSNTTTATNTHSFACTQLTSQGTRSV